MILTDDILLDFGFKKKFGWGDNYWQYTKDDKFILHPTLCQSYGKGFKMPQTTSELSNILEKYYKIMYTDLGYENCRDDIKRILNIEL